ncbi:hypothetical protein HY045_01035 [Candidatus Woesebacteria bacterium]|nr:hypothetical protein [Candidatus Woesebacteria bacterium]
MKKELAVHFVSMVVLFFLIALFKQTFNLNVIWFFVGGVLGTFLPDVDHFIYIYYLAPQELTSQRATTMLGRGNVWAALDLLTDTRYERSKLIFHTVVFQAVFTLLAFLVVTSSGSLLGKGLVLAFLLHFVVDQFIDLIKIETLTNWFSSLNINLTKEKMTLFWVFNLIVVLLFGFLF